QPLFPAANGTYYYDGYDSVGNRHVYVAATGTYYYVDSSGSTTVGDPVSLPVTTPYIATVAASATSFQFNNTHAALYTIVTSTDAGGGVTTGTGYTARSGTWFALDTAFSSASASAITIAGQTGTAVHPAAFSGERLDITTGAGSNIVTISMGNGNNTVSLKDSAITSLATKGSTGQAVLLADTANLGGNHFYGENLLVTNATGRVFAFGMGDNTITLVSSTVASAGTGAVFGWNNTTTSTRRSFAVGSFVTLENSAIITSASYAPVFQMIGDWGGATVTGGTLSTAGVGSTILRLVSQNDTNDHAIFMALFKNTVLEAQQGSVIDINVEAANSAAYGQAGGANKGLITVIDDSYDVLIESSTVSGGVAALRIGAAGSHIAPYGDRTSVLVRDSVFAGGIEMIAGGGVNETSGAYLVFSATNTQFSGGISITGTHLARISNQAAFYLYDSTFTGDITLTNRGNLLLKSTRTPIEGALSLSGSTQAELRLVDSPVTAGITVADTAVLTGEILGSGSNGPVTAHGGSIDLVLDRAPAGGITADGAASVVLLVGNDAAIPGGLHLAGSATLALTLRDASRFTGDVTINDRATLALATAGRSGLALDGSLALAGIWQISEKTTLNGGLALSGSLGTIAIANAGPDSLVLSNGLSGNGRLDILSIDGGALGNPKIRVIHDQTGAFLSGASVPLLLAHPVDYGLAAYTLKNEADGAYLVGGLAAGSFGTGGAAVFNSRAHVVEDWFAALAPLNYRLGLLREPGDAAPSRGSLWLQARADTTRVNHSGDALDFTSRAYGLTAGVDTRRDFDTATLHTGIFADTSRTLRDFTGSADGLSTSAGGGIYAHWLHRSGLHLSAIARFDVYQATLDTRNANNAMSASYNSQAGGVALEAGWRLGLGGGWWLEPAAQLSLASIPGVSYTTESSRPGNVIPITTSDARATQWLGRLALGKTLHKNWQLRGHLAAATTSASGGAFTAPGLDNADFTISGSRVEASLGVVRNIGLASRLTLDAAYTGASDYKRPCTLSMGWSMNW
ncbi:MAG: autotransporter outer membrane beta-barrel domain-containing protein, partial [Opitutaceae bacterium]|nr:autotransporter outer membrane beta-barrel domain-containing protein [Opitutaceae bacterium]